MMALEDSGGPFTGLSKKVSSLVGEMSDLRLEPCFCQCLWYHASALEQLDPIPARWCPGGDAKSHIG